jgi:hypothetical protein
MSSITPITPSFTFGYWRPWNEKSNFFESYLDYAKDVSLVKYGADTVGQYINQASQEQVQAINNLGKAIGRGMNVLSNQMSDINQTLGFLNHNMDIQIEQQKLSNLLLQNIAELLRVPDSEKERQHSIELGIKFFVNAKKDSDLYADSLEELLKAESLMKQDYFVLHRIGCIYLYVEKYINPEKAFEYFVRAAKYASVESDPAAARLASALTINFNTANSELNNSEKQIGILAADSYEKAAFAAYVLGCFEDAVNYQSKALRFNSSSENRFILSKYQVRNNNIKEALDNLDKSIEEAPCMAIAVFKELDLINEPEVIKLIAQKNDAIDNKIKQLIEKWKTVESTKASEVIIELSELSRKSYEIKIADFNKYRNEENTTSVSIINLKTRINEYIEEVTQSIYITFSAEQIETFKRQLLDSKDLPFEKMQTVFDDLKKQISIDKLQIGKNYEGGIVIYLDQTGRHGLVCADKKFGKAMWGGGWSQSQSTDEIVKIGALGNGVADGSGMANTQLCATKASFFLELKVHYWYLWPLTYTGRTMVKNAAKLCLESNYNGYKDWYLPTLAELEIIFQNKHFFPDFINYKEVIGSDGRKEFFDYGGSAIWPLGWWSSTECDGYDGSRAMGLFMGHVTNQYKGDKMIVLAVRAF